MSKMHVVIINGYPRSGNDTFIEMCRKYCTDNEMAYVVDMSTIDPVKEALHSLGWSGDKTIAARNMLSDLKKFWIEECNGGPLRYTIDYILKLIGNYAGNDVILFIQIREASEIDSTVDMLKVMRDKFSLDYTTLVIRRNTDTIATNYSDKYVDRYQYNMGVNNNGTLDELREAAEKFCDEVLQ